MAISLLLSVATTKNNNMNISMTFFFFAIKLLAHSWQKICCRTAWAGRGIDETLQEVAGLSLERATQLEMTFTQFSQFQVISEPVLLLLLWFPARFMSCIWAVVLPGADRDANCLHWWRYLVCYYLCESFVGAQGKRWVVGAASWRTRFSWKHDRILFILKERQMYFCMCILSKYFFSPLNIQRALKK